MSLSISSLFFLVYDQHKTFSRKKTKKGQGKFWILYFNKRISCHFSCWWHQSDSSQLHFGDKHKLFCAIKYIFRLVMDFEKCFKSPNGELTTKLCTLFKTVPVFFFYNFSITCQTFKCIPCAEHHRGINVWGE